MTADADLVAALAKSDLFTAYGRAYSELTGLPLAIRPRQCWRQPLAGARRENAFCALMATSNATCAACLQAQDRLVERAAERPATVRCPRGLSEGAAPIRLGDRTIGFLQTGQAFGTPPTERAFEKVLRQVRATGVTTDAATLRAAYFKTAVVPTQRLRAAVTMLDLFARHLTLRLNEIMLRQAAPEPALVLRAKAYIRERQAEPLTLEEVARAVHTSKFNLCRVFRKATGLTFTDYLARLRIERAKELLLDPQRRISEVAYEVGFQSLTHFNRVFRAQVGCSPSAQRARTAAATGGRH